MADALTFDQLTALWKMAGGDPQQARIMAFVALNESGGNPESNRSGGTSYAESGKRYYPQGLWQISTVHGYKESMFDPLANARRAVELFNAQGFGPWEASRNAGAFGGWGRHLAQETGDDFHGPAHVAALPGEPQPRLPYTSVAYAGVTLTPAQQAALQRLGASVVGETQAAPKLSMPPQFHGLVTGHPTAQQAKALDAWEWVKRHPVDALGETLGSTSRGYGAYIQWLQTPEGQRHRSMLQFIGDAVFHPGKMVGGRTTEHAATAAQEQYLFMPKEEAVRSWIGAHVPKQLANVITPVAVGLEGATAQTILDPLTYLPIGDAVALGARVARLGVALDRSHALTSALYNAAKAQQLGPVFNHLGPLLTHTADAARTAANWFRTRPELDQWFTPKGKQAFMSIERKHAVKAADSETVDRTAAASFAGTRQRLRTAYGQRNPVPGATVEERLADLRKARRAEERKGVAADLEALQRSQPKGTIFKPGTGVTLSQIQKQTPGAAFKGLIDSTPIKAWKNYVRSLLFVNPLIHGIRNVGQLFVAANGISAVPRAFHYMVRGADKFMTRDAAGNAVTMAQRLRDIGALPTYAMGERKSMIGTLIPAYDAWINKMQPYMERMEEGWRAATLEHIDAKLGKSKDTLDELMKGQMIADRIGDPHNQAAFVQFFQAVGGPWVAYRLGIVPKAMIAAIARDPSNVLKLIRPQMDIQQARSEHGQEMNELSFGGPMYDVAEMLLNPRAYLGSPSTLGLVGGLGPPSGGEQAARGSDIPRGLAYALAPAGSVAAYDIIKGQAMPGPYSHGQSTYQQMSLADKLALSVMAAFGAYFHRQPNPKTLKRIRTEIDKGPPTALQSMYEITH